LFVVNVRIEEALRAKFPGNRYFSVAQPLYERLFADCNYLRDVANQVGTPDFYYSYGIPVYRRFGRVNWFHLSNVLPVHPMRGIPLPYLDRFKLAYLGSRIRTHFGNADVISAESNWSLCLLDVPQSERLFLSVNGSDDEIGYLNSQDESPRSDNAVVVGTTRYKALADSYRVFSMLKRDHPALHLEIIGDRKHIPRELLAHDDVRALGLVERSEVIERLRAARFYISTTLIENSYNAASEGTVLAEKSYLSDIGPHREFLDGVRVDHVSVPGVERPLLCVKGKDVSTAQLKSWNDVISEMVGRFEEVSDGAPGRNASGTDGTVSTPGPSAK
jgi:glycosyltransferase involved in cell wall biosynthesis